MAWASLTGHLPRRYHPMDEHDHGGGQTISQIDRSTKLHNISSHTDAEGLVLRVLQTHRGDIRLPAYLPVTTFDVEKHPLDRLLQPYFKRLVDGIMVSYHYARGMRQPFELPTFVDSGGFVSLFQETSIEEYDDHVELQPPKGDLIHPRAVLELQCRVADIGATLDCLISPSMPLDECRLRQAQTLKNAFYAMELWQNLQEPRPLLFASLQAWDEDSAIHIVEKVAPLPFAGYALGGMVPRASSPSEIVSMVRAIRTVDRSRPLHVFGIGTPRLVRTLFENGVDAVDSSSFVRNAISGRIVDMETGSYVSPKESNGLAGGGELANMRAALGNLIDSLSFLGIHPFAGDRRGTGQERVCSLKGSPTL